jgi:hypothetical protein
MRSESEQRALLLRLKEAVPAFELVLSEDVGDVVCAWPAGWRSIEIVAANGGRRPYDAWVRPKGPIRQQQFDVDLENGRIGRVIDEPGLRLAWSGMTLKEVVAWLTAAFGGRVLIKGSRETEIYTEVAETIRSMRSL